ncbi:MAG: single-stranded-DNA-specific exonuclease RecJ [Ferruginibacter sp.]|nr:single-stranded-DNA-specific exonuclease RecJ [Ferruginibacter sp.]
MQKRWNILPYSQQQVDVLYNQLKVSKTICKILTQRNFDSFEKSKEYFLPSVKALHDPYLMKDMNKAVARIEKAISTKEKILVFGDYDVDGTTSVASMYSFLCEIYEVEKLDYYIPHRYREGYGVSKAGIDFAYTNGFSLIVCLDCGIKSVELIEYANTLGINFIICDHHLPGEVIPKAIAILNPKQIDCNYPYKELCGCGVGFKLMTALAKYYYVPDEKLFEYLDLVACAIAADIVPMTGENRILAFMGLHKINTNPLPGIKALMELGGITKIMTITNVVFVIAPRVNAAGRMDDAKKAVQLFIEKDIEKAKAFAELLHTDNKERKEADSSITEDALQIIGEDVLLQNKKTCVVYSEHWHKGVVGIVASRLIEHYYRPTIVLTKSGDYIAGSARSVPGFNLYEAIYECRDLLMAYGGHFAAAGLTLLPQNLEAFTKRFEEVVSATIPKHLLIPEIVIDAEINFDEITENFYNIICRMEPFGPENMRPTFVAKNCIDFGYSKIVKELHLKFVVKQHNTILNGIGFNMADKFSLLQNSKPVDIVFKIDENVWNDNKTLQLMVVDIKPSEK